MVSAEEETPIPLDASPHSAMSLAREEAESQTSEDGGDWDWLFGNGTTVGAPHAPHAPPRTTTAARSDAGPTTRDVRRRRGIEDAKVSAEDVGGGGGGIDDDDDDDDDGDPDESVAEPIALPQSTHTLLFTQPATSFPFVFAIAVALVCCSCLVMALLNNLTSGGGDDKRGDFIGMPANVGYAVIAAQYLSILIALIMESEIPTGLQLLRNIPPPSFRARFPNKSYGLFFASAVLRISLGYLFLINVFVICVQAKDVLEIFYNVLALEFISQLDDIAFALAKMDVLGKRMQRACTARLFGFGFKKVKFKKVRRANLCLKSVYFVNIAVFLVLMTAKTIGQQNGYYQCHEITVDLGDGVWEDPVIVRSVPGKEGGNFTLVFSYFNGVYEQDGTHSGRPVYTERRKYDNGPFDPSWWTAPAEIRYSNTGNFWVFTHPWIRKTVSAEDDVSFLGFVYQRPRVCRCVSSEISKLILSPHPPTPHQYSNPRMIPGYSVRLQRRNTICWMSTGSGAYGSGGSTNPGSSTPAPRAMTMRVAISMAYATERAGAIAIAWPGPNIWERIAR